MAGMKVSLDGLFANVETALRSSQSDMACMVAYSLMEFGENLRLVKAGKATLDELFALYVFDAERKGEPLTKRVDKRHYDCMRDEPEDVDDDAHYSAS
jgi:hypothetical protein